ncbi:secreted protein [Coprinopsis cinerea okayama7|uniref:Secreted protein n=1 Tax=Coprinopsis cinerea (strain Okayama-7 / 130 / ATCC MYA-4618 / FGSC 9003) TaxID=240176 RepID=A8P5D9_COPC7|nr:secreted protein [Coprinopsis cinerea okayama7\|eukprot:XP_001838919.1 secreted protein [Coprinopsis cinerea okayama7\
MQLKSLLVAAALALSASAAPAVEKRQGYSDYFPPIGEMAYCLNPLNAPACVAANGHAEVASSAAARLFPRDTLHNGRGDAFRHCYWNARMVIDIGATKAKEIADNHEIYSDGPNEEKLMDYANNDTGRRIGGIAYGANKNAKYTYVEDLCRTFAINGLLVTLK